MDLKKFVSTLQMLAPEAQERVVGKVAQALLAEIDQMRKLAESAVGNNGRAKPMSKVGALIQKQRAAGIRSKAYRSPRVDTAELEKQVYNALVNPMGKRELSKALAAYSWSQIARAAKTSKRITMKGTRRAAVYRRKNVGGKKAPKKTAAAQA